MLLTQLQQSLSVVQRYECSGVNDQDVSPDEVWILELLKESLAGRAATIIKFTRVSEVVALDVWSCIKSAYVPLRGGSLGSRKRMPCRAVRSMISTMDTALMPSITSVWVRLTLLWLMSDDSLKTWGVRVDRRGTKREDTKTRIAFGRSISLPTVPSLFNALSSLCSTVSNALRPIREGILRGNDVDGHRDPVFLLVLSPDSHYNNDELFNSTV